MRSSFQSRSLFAIAFLLICFLVHQSYAAVLAIDYGTEWTKAALVKPGIPLQIVLTKDTKRKEQSAVAFKKQERLYGADAFNLAARFPESTYPSLKPLLGRTVDSEVVERFLREHPANEIGSSNRSSLTFTYGDNAYSIEELVAMQLVNIKIQAEKMAEEKIKELVLTVPAFWTEQERKAIIDAAELAGMRISTLIQDGLAVAINYGTTRTFSEEPQYHLIYDMGAGSTTATVVSFSSRSVKEGKSNKTIIEITTHGIGYDRELGGDLFNTRIVDTLIDAFRTSKAGSKAKTDIISDGKAFARLFKEASRVKQALSANTDTTASIESLHEDIDFRTKVTRSTFEEITADLVDRVTLPIQVALKDANMTVDQLESVILHGGSVRVPFVQKALEDVVGTDKLAKTVNADEAAVMGAIFRGAQLNTQFRVKDIRPKDYSTFPITILSNSTLDISKAKSQFLFPRRTKLGKTKTLSFKTTEDVSFSIQYASDADLPNDISRTILTANITGVAEKIEGLKGDLECHDPTVKVHIKLTDAGLIEVLHSEVQCELREKKNLADKLKGFFGSGKENEELSEDQIVFHVPKDESSASLSATGTATPDDTSEKVRYEKSALRVSVVDKSPVYLTPEQKMASKKLLVAMDRVDFNRVAREEALNSLEAYIYRARDFLEDDVFQKVSSVEERNLFEEKLESTSEWLFSSDSATLEDFKFKFSELTNIESPISKRKADFLIRPQRIETLQQILNSTKELVQSSRAILDKKGVKDEDALDDDDEASTTASLPLQPFQLDEKAITTLDKVVTEIETWLNEKVAAQEKLNLWEEPVLLLTELERKGNQVQSAVRKIFLEQAKQKTKSSTSTATTTENPQSETSIHSEVEEDLEEVSTITETVTATILETEAASKAERKHEEL